MASLPGVWDMISQVQTGPHLIQRRDRATTRVAPTIRQRNRSTSLHRKIPDILPNTEQAGVYPRSFKCPRIPLPVSLPVTTISQYPAVERKPCKKLSDYWRLKTKSR